MSPRISSSQTNTDALLTQRPVLIMTKASKPSPHPSLMTLNPRPSKPFSMFPAKSDPSHTISASRAKFNTAEHRECHPEASHKSRAPPAEIKVCSFYVKIMIGGHEHWALIDSGFQSSIIPHKKTRGLRIEKSSKILKAANESTIKVLGEINTWISLSHNSTSRIKFIVSDAVPEIIIGTDFLLRHNCHLDLSKNLMTLGSLSIPLHRRSDRPGVNKIIAVEEITLKPRSIRLIKSQILIGKKNNTSAGVWLLDNVEVKPGIYVARSRHSPEEPFITAQIINTSKEAFTTKPNLKLGKLAPVETTSPLTEIDTSIPEWTARMKHKIDTGWNSRSPSIDPAALQENRAFAIGPNYRNISSQAPSLPRRRYHCRFLTPAAPLY